jgi:hypothetical protein
MEKVRYCSLLFFLLMVPYNGLILFCMIFVLLLLTVSQWWDIGVEDGETGSTQP